MRWSPWVGPRHAEHNVWADHQVIQRARSIVARANQGVRELAVRPGGTGEPSQMVASQHYRRWAARQRGVYEHLGIDDRAIYGPMVEPGEGLRRAALTRRLLMTG